MNVSTYYYLAEHGVKTRVLDDSDVGTFHLMMYRKPSNSPF